MFLFDSPGGSSSSVIVAKPAAEKGIFCIPRPSTNPNIPPLIKSHGLSPRPASSQTQVGITQRADYSRLVREQTEFSQFDQIQSVGNGTICQCSRFWRPDSFLACSSMTVGVIKIRWRIWTNVCRNYNKTGIVTWRYSCTVSAIDFYGGNSNVERQNSKNIGNNYGETSKL